MKIIRKLIIFLVFVVIVGVPIILISDKALGGNTFERAFTRIQEILTPDEEDEEIPIDTTPLEVSSITSVATILEPMTAITVHSNKEIFVDDTEKYSLFKVGTFENQLWYALEIKNLGVGSAVRKIPLHDQAGMTQELEVAITRLDFTLPFGLTELEDWEGAVYTARGDELLAQVNKEHKLIDDYVPIDLKNLNADYLLYTNTGSILLRQEAADYLKLMLEALKKDTGKNVVIASGYRSYDEQYKLYTNWVRQLGQEEADKVSARPGFSEHQLGTVVDFIDEETGLILTNNFGGGTAGKWLSANAANYGYVQSYPAGKESVTGYLQEDWHYRYVGIDNAKAVKESGLTLKEWIENIPV